MSSFKLNLTKLAFTDREYRDVILPFLMSRDASKKSDFRDLIKSIPKKSQAQKTLSYLLHLYSVLEAIEGGKKAEIKQTVSLKELPAELQIAYASIKQFIENIDPDNEGIKDIDGLKAVSTKIRGILENHIQDIIAVKATLPTPESTKKDKTKSEAAPAAPEKKEAEIVPADYISYIDLIKAQLEVYKYEGVIYQNDSLNKLRTDFFEKDDEDLEDFGKKIKQNLTLLYNAQKAESDIRSALKPKIKELYPLIVGNIAHEDLKLFEEIVGEADASLKVLEIEEKLKEAVKATRRDRNADPISTKSGVIDSLIAGFEKIKSVLN